MKFGPAKPSEDDEFDGGDADDLDIDDDEDTLDIDEEVEVGLDEEAVLGAEEEEDEVDDLDDETDADEDVDDDADFDADSEVTCPYCSETITILLDPGSGSTQDYVEDCEVCCRPWRVRVRYNRAGRATVHVDPAQ